MDKKPITSLIDPADKKPVEEWMDVLEDIAEDHGYFEPLGPDHSAIFIEGGHTLFVTFETIDSVRSSATSDVPLAWELATPHGWSHLCLLAHGDTWFRHRAIYQYFDRLVDEGFFDNFDNVVFYGAHSCGYAACAFSVAAPGATVIATTPHATLDPRVTEWEHRFVDMRRTSFTDRYGFGPDMIDAADHAYILYDPEIEEDAMHASLYTRPNVTKVRCRHLNGEIEDFLRQSKVMEPIIKRAMAKVLKPAHFYKALRRRRSYLPYLRRFLGAVEEQQRPFLTALMCRSVLERINTPRFRRELKRSQMMLGEQGKRLPESRSKQKA